MVNHRSSHGETMAMLRGNEDNEATQPSSLAQDMALPRLVTWLR